MGDVKMTEEDHTCPICEGSIDREHYLFVVETMMDPKKIQAYMNKEWSFKIWKKSKKESLT